MGIARGWIRRGLVWPVLATGVVFILGIAVSLHVSGGIAVAQVGPSGCVEAPGYPCPKDSPSRSPRIRDRRVQPREKADPATEAFRTGYRLSNQGRYSEAEGYYRRAIALNPRYASAHWNLSGVLYRQGRYNESVAETREALRLDPRNTKYKQRLVEWEEYFQKKREQAERNARMDALNAARKRGIDLYEKNDYRGAEAAFREAIRIFPDNAGSHYNLGLSLEYQKRWSEAVDAYREAMRLNPNYSKARDNLRQAEAELRKEREWQARREEERREREQEAQRGANMSRVLADLKKEKPSPSEGFPIRIKPFKWTELHKRHAKVNTSPSIHGLGGMKTAGQQLRGAAALGKGAGRRPFDTEGPAGRPLNIRKNLGRNPWKAPVVTDEDRRRVPAIVEHERKRSEARKRRSVYQAKLEELKSLPESEKPRDWSVQVAEAEQNTSNAGNEEIYYNFQIGEALRNSNIPK